MTGKLFFLRKMEQENIRDLYIFGTFGKLMVLLITSIWNACLFQIQLGSTLLLKRILPSLTRSFIENELLGRKFVPNLLKTPVKEQWQTFTMHDLLSFTRNFQVPETSARFPNSQSNCYRSISSYLHLCKTQNSENFIDLTNSISLLSDSLKLINLRTREYCTFPLF